MLGLRLSAAGESTEALDALGLSRSRQQYLGVVISGLLAGIGGCLLASEAHYFTKGMTAGRGYVALAAVIFGKWKPLGSGAACLRLFGFASALELANRWHIPPQLLNSLPYLLTMIVLVGVIGKANPPSELGQATLTVVIGRTRVSIVFLVWPIFARADEFKYMR